MNVHLIWITVLSMLPALIPREVMSVFVILDTLEMESTAQVHRTMQFMHYSCSLDTYSGLMFNTII